MLQKIGLAAAALAIMSNTAANNVIPKGGIIWQSASGSDISTLVITNDIEEDSNRWNRQVLPAGTVFQIVTEVPLKACRKMSGMTYPVTGAKYFVDCVVDRNGDGLIYDYIPYYRFQPISIKSNIKFEPSSGQQGSFSFAMERRLVFDSISGTTLRLKYFWLGGTEEVKIVEKVKIDVSKGFPILIKIRDTSIEILSASDKGLVARVTAAETGAKNNAPNQ